MLFTFVNPIRDSVEDLSGFSVRRDWKDLIAPHGGAEVNVAAVDVGERVAAVGPFNDAQDDQSALFVG